MKKRTVFDEAAERETLQLKALTLIKALTTAGPGTRAEQSALRKMRALARRVVNRERQDRCYYCGARKKELAQEANTGVCQCLKCAGNSYAFYLQATQKLKERLNEGYML